MYSYEDRVRAVELYLKLGKRIKATIRQLGYPTKNSLKAWCEEFERHGDLQKEYVRAKPKYSEEQKNVALEHYILTGPTGAGKTWIACAFGQQACRQGFSVMYVRVARLFEELKIAHGDGSFTRRLAKMDVLLLDDWGLQDLDQSARNDLLEVLDDRVGTRSTIITSQLPLEHWHAWLQDPTLADAILDRLVHQAHKLPLKGESMRKTNAKQSSAS
ncbi:ATP-binding protein [Burkholderia sp. 22PA0106]|uniref:ATP-binding protein n=1 Tax=Burkholderia sp. 22PA0106 TaxID=3237371 RepID=UPI0039C0A19A